jgi:hypothetical protein
MTPERRKMLDALGFYLEATASGGGTDGYYGGEGRVGVGSEWGDLGFGAGVSGYGYKNPDSGVRLVPTYYDANLNYATDEYGDFGIGGKFDPNSENYNIFAKWEKRF